LKNRTVPFFIVWLDRFASDQDGIVVGEARVFGARGQGRLKCRGTMKIVAFITDYTAVDRIIGHLKL